MENKNGNFGTLVLVRGNIKANEEKTYFQIRNTKISIELTSEKKFNPIDKESSNKILYNTIYEINSDNNYINNNNNYN